MTSSPPPPPPDSDDELEESQEGGFSQEPILEPKDHYSFRPLPLRIGTSAFLSEDDVGLVDYASDSEGGCGILSLISVYMCVHSLFTNCMHVCEYHNMCTNARTHTHAHMHTHIHMHTHTHTHTHAPPHLITDEARGGGGLYDSDEETETVSLETSHPLHSFHTPSFLLSFLLSLPPLPPPFLLSLLLPPFPPPSSFLLSLLFLCL